MDTTILANLDNIPAVDSFLKAQSVNDNTNSPLYQAQLDANKYMSMKQRVPMVLEYYPDKDDEQPISVEMYINPSRLNVSTQKIIGKAVTRGGIFYHHWGDDHLTMQLSGTTGLSGMKGLQRLEKVYAYSGALLHYINLGPNKVSGSVPSFELVDNGNPFSGLEYVMQNNVSENTISNVSNQYASKIQTSNNSMLNSQDQILISKTKLMQINAKLINNYQNVIQNAKSIALYNQIYNYMKQYVKNNRTRNGQHISSNTIFQETQRQVLIKFPNLSPALQSMMAQDLTNAICSSEDDPNNDLMSVQQPGLGLGSNSLTQLNNVSSDYIGNFVNTSLPIETVNNQNASMGQARMNALKKYVTDIQDYNVRSKISEDTINTAVQDINDELKDEWRPRQIIIYFEDRIYIGHFDSFSYQRSAEAPLIQYDMRFTVTRQIIVTSNN